jgi:transcriptional regulator with XRE-family HTH domain
MPLLEKLKAAQGHRPQQEFARELGISQTMLSQIYRKERRIGLRVGRAICRKYPSLTSEVLDFLLSGPSEIA